MNYTFDFGVLSPYWSALARGVVQTLAITAIVIAIGTPLGILAGIALRSRIRPLRYLMYTIVDAIRAVPILVLIYMTYYLLPLLPGFPHVSAMFVACTALSLYLAAFQADVIRGAISAVPAVYTDAARALGMTPNLITRRIALPYVLRTTASTTALLWIGMLKNSSLASVIGVVELTHTASTISSNTFRSIETYLAVGGAYVLLVVPFSMLARRIETSLMRFNALYA